MKINLQHPRHGIAIIIVMISIFALAVLAGAFAYSMKVETKLAANSINETQLQWAGRSGIDYARWVIFQETAQPGPGQRYRSLDQAWAGGNSESNDVLAGIHLNEPLAKQGPGVIIKRIVMEDTERKFNINMAVTEPQVLKQALILAGADVTQISIITSSVQDWITPPGNPRIGGAESDYYESLDPPYMAKNGPIEELSELLMIKGIRDAPELYWGSDVTNHPRPLFQQQVLTPSGLQTAPIAAPVRLVDILTPISNGAINILTASRTQLQVLPGVDDNIAGQIVQLRGEIGDSGLPYNSPVDLLANTSLGNQSAQQVAAYCTFMPSTYEVKVLVQVGMSERTYFALIRQNGPGPDSIPILNMRWEDGDQTGGPAPDDQALAGSN